MSLMLCVTCKPFMLSVVMLNVVMLSVTCNPLMMIVFMLSVVMLNVTYAEWHM